MDRDLDHEMTGKHLAIPDALVRSSYEVAVHSSPEVVVCYPPSEVESEAVDPSVGEVDQNCQMVVHTLEGEVEEDLPRVWVEVELC